MSKSRHSNRDRRGQVEGQPERAGVHVCVCTRVSCRDGDASARSRTAGLCARSVGRAAPPSTGLQRRRARGGTGWRHLPPQRVQLKEAGTAEGQACPDGGPAIHSMEPSLPSIKLPPLWSLQEPRVAASALCPRPGPWAGRWGPAVWGGRPEQDSGRGQALSLQPPSLRPASPILPGPREAWGLSLP